jgi:hypothetical protein
MYEWKNHKISRCVGMYRIIKEQKEIELLLLCLNSWCYARGKNVWKTWKRRYYALVQV